MQLRSKAIYIACLLIFPFFSFAQTNTMVLKCPFEHGSGREPKEAFTWNPPDRKVILISQVDSVVHSAIDGVITNVDRNEDSSYEIVINSKDFYFWYYGAGKPFVKKGQTVKAGEIISKYKFGTELEFRMFKNEDILDPRDLLECKVPKAE